MQKNDSERTSVNPEEAVIVQCAADKRLSSVSSNLLALLLETYIFRGPAESKVLLICSLGADLENWRCVDGDVGDKLVAESEEAIDEVKSLSEAACKVLFSVTELAQVDRTESGKDALIRKWMSFLKAQDEDTYRAPVMLDEWVREKTRRKRSGLQAGEPFPF